MTPKYIVIAESLHYHGDSFKVPAYYHEAAKKLAESTKNGIKIGFLSVGNIKCVVTDDVAKAVEILAKDIGAKIKNWWGNWKGFEENDFTFEILFTEIKDGRGWLMPCATYCHKYPVKFN